MQYHKHGCNFFFLDIISWEHTNKDTHFSHISSETCTSHKPILYRLIYAKDTEITEDGCNMKLTCFDS